MICLILGWLCCSVLSAGTSFAYFQGAYPTIAEETYGSDLALAILFGLLFGPFGLLIGAVFSGFWTYGWRLW